MLQLLWYWLQDALTIAKGNLNFMVWNSFLAVIPFFLSLWLFRGQKKRSFRFQPRSQSNSQSNSQSSSQVIPRAKPLRPQPSPLWWLGLGIFFAFLPNAPYVLTDVIHLVDDIRRGHSIWIITLILIPQYLLFMVVGFEAYVGALINLGHYLRHQGKGRWIGRMEVMTHGLCAIGIYLGRFPRFNSWDIITRPDVLVTGAIDHLFGQRPLIIVGITFVVILSLYSLLKHITLALGFYWRQGRTSGEAYPSPTHETQINI